jgi:hypothetical protein
VISKDVALEEITGTLKLLPVAVRQMTLSRGGSVRGVAL